MKLILFLFLSLATVPSGMANDIAEINALKEAAKEAYMSGDYEAAIAKYNTLINAYGVQDDDIRLNLAHAQYKNNDLEGAMGNYSQLLTSSDDRIRSAAYNQMGLIAHQQKKLKASLSNFKDALKADDENDEARYNYSVVKKELEQQQQQQKNQDKQQQNKDKQQQQEQNKEKKNQQGEGKEEEQKKEEGEKKEGEENKEGEQQKQEQQKPGQQGEEKEQQQGEEQEDTEQMPQSTAERLEEMSIPKEKAQMILEAMKNNEIQYLQQNQRKSRSKADSGKPYW